MPEQVTVLVQRLPESLYWDVHAPGKATVSMSSIALASEETVRLVQQLGGTAMVVVDDQNSILARKSRRTR